MNLKKIQKVLSVPLMTAWTRMTALLDQGQCSASCSFELFTKLFSNSPLQEVKCFPKKYADNTLISNSFKHWTLVVLSTWEAALKWSGSLSQPGGHSRATKGFHVDTMSGCTGLSAVLKFSFLKHLLWLPSAFACPSILMHSVFTSTEWFHVCLLLTLYITNISNRIHKTSFTTIALSILLLGRNFEIFVIDPLLAAKRYIIQFLCYTGKPPSRNKLLECV